MKPSALLEVVTSARDPSDVDAAIMLSGFFNRNKDTPNAIAALDRALKAKPENPDLLLARAQLSGSSPQQMKQIRLKEAAKIAQPLDRELAMFELTSDEADQNIPLGHLKAAEGIDPKEPRASSTRCSNTTWPATTGIRQRHTLEKLADINADKVKGTLLALAIDNGPRPASEQDTKRRSAKRVAPQSTRSGHAVDPRLS